MSELMKGICTVGVSPIRSDNSHASEMVSQLLFGEIFSILETDTDFIKIKADYDSYEGWISAKQYLPIDDDFTANSEKETFFVGEFFSEVINSETQKKINISIGCLLPHYKNGEFYIGSDKYYYKGKVISNKADANDLFGQLRNFEGVSYLWGGRSMHGFDCSGFSQLIYKLLGYKLPRNSKQQAEIGNNVYFISEAVLGDLAFFAESEQAEEITHVGIMLNNNKIMHASGIVKIDDIDSYGIIDKPNSKYSHVLKLIKRIL